MAAMYGDLDEVRRYIVMGVDASDALVYSAFHGDIEAVRRYILIGVDVNSKTRVVRVRAPHRMEPARFSRGETANE